MARINLGFTSPPKPRAILLCCTLLVCSARLILAQTTLPDTRASLRCDGHSDDALALQAALDRAAGQSGAVVTLPPTGTCLLDRNVKLPDGVTLRGGATLKPTPANASTPVLLALGSNIIIDGPAFEGGGPDFPNPAPLLQAYKAHAILLQHISVRHTRGPAIIFSTAIVGSAVRDSTFSDIGNHWKSTHLPADRKAGVIFCCGAGNSGNEATGNHFADIGLDALQFSEQVGLIVRANHFALANGQNASLPAPHYPAAIFLLHDNGAMVEANEISGAQGNCIDAPALQHATIRKNRISNCGASGIGVFDTASYGETAQAAGDTVISENSISRAGQWDHASPAQRRPIAVKAGSTNITVRGNIIEGVLQP